MSDFKALCQEGNFGWDNGPAVNDIIDGGTFQLRDLFEPFLDRHVAVHLYHVPDPSPSVALGMAADALFPGAPRTDCCTAWPCEYHQKNPGKRLAFDGTGVLRTGVSATHKQTWWLESPTGGTITLLPIEAMLWHHGRVMMTTILSLSGVDSHRG